MSDKPTHNPYSSAAEAYGTTAASTDPRALEGKILLKAAHKLENLATRLKNGEKVHFAEVGEILDYNQKLWTLFVNDAMDPDHPLPQEIKNNIASLGVFIFKRTKDVLIETAPEKLKVLIDINRNIAAGLMKKTAAPEGSGALSAPPEKTGGKKATDSVA